MDNRNQSATAWSRIRFGMAAMILSCLLPDSVVATVRPNFVVVLCDDLGYGDLRCYGNQELKTPHIDQFAAQGMRLTSCYASHPNCSPSRTGLMTGRTPMRVGIHDWIPMLSPMHVPAEEVTIAKLLQQNGYATALCGKWHLNGRFNLTGQPQPNDHGFDHWFATQNNCLPNHRNPYNFVRNGIPLGPLEGYASQLVTAEAIQWLTTWRDKSKPFFLFVSYHEPHEPIATAEQFKRMYPSDDPSYSAHHGNISQMDASFGKLMSTLSELGLNDNTLVFFTSDNGPAKTAFHPNGSAGPLRDKKGYISDGGIRVPGILRWPGRIKPSLTSDVPIIGTDLLPSLCELARIKPPSDRKLDGTSFVPIFAGKTLQRKTPLYWHFYGASGQEKVAIRMGDWKLTAEMEAPKPRQRASIDPIDQRTIKTAALGKMALFHLQQDIGETKDLSKQQPQRFAKMKAILLAKYREVQQESRTWPAWKFARYESQRIVWPSYRGAKQVKPRSVPIPPDYRNNPLIQTIER